MLAGRRCRPGRACRLFVEPICDGPRIGLASSACELADSAEKAVGRHLGDPLPTIRALLEMLFDGLRRRFAELAQAVGIQDLVGRVRGPSGVHRAVSGDGSSDGFQR